MLVHEAYSAVAAKISQDLAVVTDAEEVAYSALVIRSQDIARELRGLGAKLFGTVAIMSERCVETVSTYIGVSMLGSSLLPLPTWAEAQATSMQFSAWEKSVRFALAEGGVSILVVDSVFEELRSVLPDFPHLAVVTVAQLRQAKTASDFAPETVAETATVLKLLSGGSTGSPKLYEISHRVVVSELRNYPIVVGVSLPKCRVLQQSPAVWPASQFGQLNLALALRGCAVITTAKKPEEMAAAISRHGVTVIGGAPSQLVLVSDFLKDGEKIEVFLTWGEPLPKSVGQRLKQSADRVIELLVATEYWLCMYCTDLSSRFEIVPDCKISVLDADEHGIGQLQLAGPMVATTCMTTQDLVRRVDEKIEFVGRRDFLTKIGANWFDVSVIEKAVVAAGANMFPRIVECCLVTTASDTNPVFSLVVSIEEEEGECESDFWLAEIRRIVAEISPVVVAVRILTSALPKTAAGKLDRRKLIALIDQKPTHVAAEKAFNRFRSEFFSHARWAAAFAAACGIYAPVAPFMYLATLHVPRSEFLPRSPDSSFVAQLSRTLIDFFRRDFPFGIAGLIVLVVRLRNASRWVKRVLNLWILYGMVCAIRGRRLLSFPVAFWAGAGAAVRDDASDWFSTRKWKRLFRNVRFTLLAVPDMFIGTTFCSPVAAVVVQSIADVETVPESTRRNTDDDEPRETPDEPAKAEEEGVVSESPVAAAAPATAEDIWWKERVVEFIKADEPYVTPRRLSVDDAETPGVCADTSTFIRETMRSVLGETFDDSATSLRGLPSLRVTELVQRLRLKIPAVSARIVMDSHTVGELVAALELSVQAAADVPTSDSVTTQRRAKIQFSPGQINRPCRWMIKAQRPVDRERLERAVAELEARHALLRSEMADPKPFHSFMYDGGVMVANTALFFGDHWLTNFMACAVHAAWTELVVYPPGKTPGYWIKPVVATKVSGREYLRKRIMEARRTSEEPWNTFQRPLTVEILSVRDGEEFILISVKHSVSDGNSAFPILDELALLYDDNRAELPPPIDPVPELERRFKDGLLCARTNPNRTSLRTQLFYSRSAEQLGGGYFRHYICFKKGAIAALREAASTQLHMGFDSALLAIFMISLMRTDKNDKQTMTLYSPLRDGAGESSFIGLLADWRDLTVQAIPGATVLDVAQVVADRVRRRAWEPTLSPGGPESVLLNWMPFDGKTRLRDKSWQQYHVDNITMRWNRFEERDFDFDTPMSGRFRSMSLEQYDADGDWWLRCDVFIRMYSAEWMMRFSDNMKRTFDQVIKNPLQPL